MRVLIFSKYPTVQAERLLRKHGLTPVRSRPEAIICWGGDGTFLLAERRYPGIPKLLVRRNSICRKCTDLPMDEVARRLAEGKFHIVEEPKLVAEVRRKGKRLMMPPAANDVVIRNRHQMAAVRFSVKAGGKPLAAGQIGDGLIAATPFGSSGYYGSITRSTFDHGIGLAFNNTVEEQPGFVLDGSARIEVIIDRGEALASTDADKKTVLLGSGDRVRITRAKDVVRLVQF